MGSCICGFVAVFVTLQVRRRAALWSGRAIGLRRLWLPGCWRALTFGHIKVDLVSFPNVDWQTLGAESLAAIGSGMLTAMIVSGALPMFETMFRLTDGHLLASKRLTSITFSCAASPSRRRGTYHHLAGRRGTSRSPPREIVGANPTMCRVCAYFHDIGKLVKPEYFTENMRAGRNPHDDLAPTMSALIIIAHVKEGVDLALKHNLNQRIIDVIQEHHGTSMVGYFYKRALQQQEDARQGGKIMNMREEDIPDVREESFIAMAAPAPQSREAGIISLADAVESASRCLEKVTPTRLEQLIHDIIEKRIIDGQLDECDLTMREIRAIAENFAYTLTNMLHSRIAYPTETAARPSETFRFPENAPSRLRRLENFGKLLPRSPSRERVSGGRSVAQPPLELTPELEHEPSGIGRMSSVCPLSAHRSIHVYNRQRGTRIDLPWLRRFAPIALAECEREAPAANAPLSSLEEIEVSIVSDRAIADVHVRFMNIAGATDVITFEHGEIIISAATAARYAQEFHQPLGHELGLYIIHGLLHLNGHDDLAEPAATRMKKTQGEILQRVLEGIGCRS